MTECRVQRHQRPTRAMPHEPTPDSTRPDASRKSASRSPPARSAPSSADSTSRPAPNPPGSAHSPTPPDPSPPDPSPPDPSPPDPAASANPSDPTCRTAWQTGSGRQIAADQSDRARARSRVRGHSRRGSLQPPSPSGLTLPAGSGPVATGRVGSADQFDHEPAYNAAGAAASATPDTSSASTTDAAVTPEPQ